MMYSFEFFFFFQAEDGIRDKLVTGVQTCALPIYLGAFAREQDRGRFSIAEDFAARPRAGDDRHFARQPGHGADQAVLTAFFSSLFFVFSSVASAAFSTRSIRLTSASGALSPLRKPVFRIR